MMNKLQLSVTDGGTLHEFSLYYKERTCSYAATKTQISLNIVAH